MGLNQMIRDIAVASINKGQFPAFVVGMNVFAAILKMPPRDVSTLVFRFLEAGERHELLGYALSGLITIGWFVHARFQRRLIHGELSRVSSERNRAQGHVLGNRIKSSEGRK